MALAGVAAADQSSSSLVTSISSQLEEQNYVTGDGFSITLTLVATGWDANNKASLLSFGGEFGTNDYLRVETSADGLSGAWIGVEISGIDWDVANTVRDTESRTNTLTFDTPTKTWLSFETSSTGNAKTKSDLQNASITLSYDCVSKTSSVTVLNASGVTSILNYKNTEWDASKIGLSGWTAATWGDTVTVSVTPMVPEPTTATLSLLALAGLAARRRRK